jgi:DNA-binding PadR family transcriptional regulator
MIRNKKRKTVYAITEKGRTALTNFKEITKAPQTTEETQRTDVFILKGLRVRLDQDLPHFFRRDKTPKEAKLLTLFYTPSSITARA